ncbi:MAG: 5-formyltetrahydrofolate cyclo-ligase [Gammaproteobacteria bacterium]
MPSPETPTGKQLRAQIRKRIRAQRRELSTAARSQAAAGLVARVPRIKAFSGARTIAAYLPFDGEIDLRPLIQAGIQAGKRFCLPTIDRRLPGVMQFCRFDQSTILLQNRWGIPEPQRRSTVQLPLRQIDVVLLPLVAFDLTGNRLGMGAGYYDRLLQRRSIRSWRRPVLIGVAFELQKTDRLIAAPWDIALDWVVTEKQIYRMRSTLKHSPSGEGMTT